MATGTPTAPKVLIGASIPRSGHHFLQNMLSSYYGDTIFYCEFYNPKNCCKTVPCTQRGQHSVIYQKNHDRDLMLRQDVQDALYIVQYRHPVPEALSDRELDLEDGIGRRSVDYRLTSDYYSWWLATKAVYYRKFHDKWLANPMPNTVYLDYTKLSKDPVGSLKPIIEWASGSFDEARLNRVVEESKSTRVSGVKTTFQPRVVEQSPHFNADLLGVLEAYVVARCPNFKFARQLSGSFENHPLYGLIRLRDPDEPLPSGERDRLAVAAASAPKHPEVQLRLAQKDLQEGSTEKAIARLKDIVKTSPFFAPAYRLLLSTCKKAGSSIPASSFDGNALLACSDSPEMLVSIGAAFLEQDHFVSAIAALSFAVALEPDNKRAIHLLAVALFHEKRLDQAHALNKRVLELDPENVAASKLLTHLRKRMAG